MYKVILNIIPVRNWCVDLKSHCREVLITKINHWLVICTFIVFPTNNVNFYTAFFVFTYVYIIKSHFGTHKYHFYSMNKICIVHLQALILQHTVFDFAVLSVVVDYYRSIEWNVLLFGMRRCDIMKTIDFPLVLKNLCCQELSTSSWCLTQ